MSRTLAFVFVGLAGALWASSGVAAQDFFETSGKTAMELTNIRMCFAGFIMLLISLHGKFKFTLNRINKRPRLWLDIIIYGVVGIMFMQFTYFRAISIGGAAASTVIIFAYPAMVVFWDSLYFKKFPKIGEVVAVIFAMTGVFLLVTGGNPGVLIVPAACIFWSLASGACFAFSTIFPKHLFASKIDSYFLTGVGMFIGGLSTFPLIESVKWSEFFAADLIFDTVWIIIFGTVAAFLSFNAGLKFLTPEEASITATVEPAASVIISGIIFGTTFGLIETIGIILVIFAIITPIIMKKNPALD